MSALGPAQDRAVARVRRALASRRSAAVTIALGLLLVVPSIATGMHADDYWHELALTGSPRWSVPKVPPWGVFAFFTGDAKHLAALTEAGMTVWWSHPLVTANFLRPLASLTHALDHAAWPGAPWLMHVHSLGWYLLVLLAALLAYRRVLPSRPALASLAMLAYATDFAHAAPVGWVANRNALVATAPALLAVGLHAANAARPRPATALGAAAALGTGLLGGETALGALGFFVAHALVLDGGTRRARLARLLPYAPVVLAWTLVYRLGNHGAAHGGVYVDPGRDPLGYAASVGRTFPLLLGASLGVPAPDAFVFLPEAGRVFVWTSSSVLVVAILALLARHVRARAEARFFLLGGALALLPMSATFPHSRLLLLPGFGLCGLVASYVEAVFEGELRAPAGALARLAFTAYARWATFARFVVSPVLLVPLACQMVLFGRTIEALSAGLGDDAALASQRVVLVNTPDSVFTPYIAVLRAKRGEPAPRAMLSLASGARDVTVETIDARTLVARVPSGLYTYGTETLLRSPEDAMPRGTKIVLSDVTIEVLATTSAGVPTDVAFRFAAPLDDRSLRFVEWKDHTLVPFAPPAAGASVTIRGQSILL